MKKFSVFIVTFFSFLFFALPAFANDGVTYINFDGTNYSIKGTTSQPDGNGQCVLDDYGNVYINEACTITNGVFSFSWPASTYTPEANHQLGSYGYNVWACSPYDGTTCTGGGAFADMFDPYLFNTVPHGVTSVGFDGTNYSVQGKTSNPDGSQYCLLEDYGTVYINEACSVSGGSFSFSWPATTYTPEANHQPLSDEGYNVVVCANQTCSGTADFADNHDSHLFDSLFTNHAPSVNPISVSPNPVQVSNSTTASASFSDADTADTHTASWNWGDGNTTSGTVTESNGSGTVSNSHTYSSAGVYTVTLTVTDNHGATGQSTFQYVSVYNPTSQGLFSAGQRFTSPAGAYSQNTSLTGTVRFGLSYKYQGSVPVGDKQFTMNFSLANLAFNATNVSSLVISNSMATLTGTGTINGSGSYDFLVTGVNGGGIRIQITDSSNNVIYDTQPGDAATATPTTSVTGNVVVHN